jgi:uncharacterized protein YaaW (UPF0174 family)
MSEAIPNKMSETILNRIPENMPDKISKNILNRMSENQILNKKLEIMLN